MNEAVIHLHPPGRLAALVGNPNAGKTALFNRLTGSNQKVANYAGVTGLIKDDTGQVRGARVGDLEIRARVVEDGRGVESTANKRLR